MKHGVYSFDTIEYFWTAFSRTLKWKTHHKMANVYSVSWVHKTWRIKINTETHSLTRHINTVHTKAAKVKCSFKPMSISMVILIHSTKREISHSTSATTTTIITTFIQTDTKRDKWWLYGFLLYVWSVHHFILFVRFTCVRVRVLRTHFANIWYRWIQFHSIQFMICIQMYR